MAGLFSFTVKSEAVLAGLGAINTRVRDLTPFWRDVFAPNYFAQVQDLFTMQGQPRDASSGQFLSGRWAPLTPEYAAWKARHFPGMPILQRTERLRRSLEWDGANLGPEGVFVPTTTSVLIGTTVPYGQYHQRGTSKMVARPFLPTPNTQAYKTLLRNWILSGACDYESGSFFRYC